MRADRADVVVIGAGAAGAALTWRLATRGVAVVCLEQGDWLRPSRFRVRADEFRGAAPARPLRPASRQCGSGPRTTRSSPPVPARPTWSCGTAWAAARSIGKATFRASIRPTSASASSTASPTTGRSAYADLEPFYDLNDANIGVSGVTGDPANPRRSPRDRRRPCRSAAPASRRRPRLREAGLALVAVRQRHPLARLRRPHRLRQSRPLQLRLRAQGQSLRRRHLLAESAQRRREAPTQGAREGNHRRRRWAVRRGRRISTRRQPPRAARSGRRRLLQRHRHAAHPAGVEVAAVSRRPRQFSAASSARTS